MTESKLNPDNLTPPRYRGSLLSAFHNAIRGILIAFKNERNLQVQMVIATVVIFAGIVFELNITEWAIISISISFVIVTEMLNTAIENTLNRISLEEHPLTRNAKDVAAGAVLISCIAAVVIGCQIFIPKILGN
ncbi:diacylglycerol kinase [Rubinisphaera italica]|uniref:Undecaprenol kinase n=1 Tax=Rubinisphaera italica TaxID=2527969 RepID=A0A5C5XPH6_9PLAN|nr:diacylglycerol kinase family protein [Rubinisphaera italica]TWT64293.1 Undecaprenol kinase [Rubinisphaera italica]